MTKLTDPKLTPLQPAVDELQRELNVRQRCFPKWVDEGRVSRTDAQDRLDRQHTALAYLNALQAMAEADTVLMEKIADFIDQVQLPSGKEPV